MTDELEGHDEAATPEARLLRVVHVCNAQCRCPPSTDLHAQAQAQPPYLSFEVACVAHAVHPITGAELLVLALSTNGMILRLKGTQGAENVDAGDYFLEWPAAPGDAKDHQPFRIMCIAISPDLRYLLCVTSAGNAYGFQTLRMMRAASRIYDEEPVSQVQWASPLGPSLVAYSQDPKYHREGPGGGATGQELRARAIALGSRSARAVDFEPRCCIWWITKGAAPYVLVGGKVGEFAAVSVVDMLHEREVDLLQVSRSPSPPVISLSIHPWGDGGRMLFMHLEDQRWFSMMLEACAPTTEMLQLATPPRQTFTSSNTTTQAYIRSPSSDIASIDSAPPGSPLPGSTRPVSYSDPTGLSRQVRSTPSTPLKGVYVGRADETEKERDADSLWHRVAKNAQGTPVVASPKQPRFYHWPVGSCTLEQSSTNGGGNGDANMVAVLGQLGSRNHSTGLSPDDPGGGVMVGRLLGERQEYVLELHSCGSSSLSDAPSASSPSGTRQECRRLCVIDLQPCTENVGVCVQDVLSAKAAAGMLVLSCACAPSPPPATTPPSTPHAPPPRESAATTYWLLLFQVSLNGPSVLFRVFRSPTSAPIALLDWLPPANPDWRDIILLSRQRLLRPPTSASGPDDVLVSRIVAWSGCAVLLLRLLGERRWQSRFIDLPLADTEGPSPAVEPMPPGTVLTFLEDLVAAGHADCAVTFGWTLLLDSPPDTGPVLHTGYFRALCDTDSALKSAARRAELALRVVTWMCDTSAGGLTSQLRMFLALCHEYVLVEMVSLLLGHGRTSEALYASWVRGGVAGVEETVRQLSSGGSCVPLGKEDVAWLCTHGAGKALLAADGSALWASMPLELQLELVLAEDCLMLLPDQYEWLLRTVLQFPRTSLAALIYRLATWLQLDMDDNTGLNREDLRWFAEGDVAPMLAALRRGCLPQLMAQEPPSPELAATAPVDEEDEKRRGRELRLSQLLLFALIAFARPLAGSLLVVAAHGWGVGGDDNNFETMDKPRWLLEGVEQVEQQALEAQLLLEGLLRVWTRRNVGPSALSSAYNLRFTPALLLARALLSENAGCAALLLQSNGRWVQSLELRLKEIRAACRRLGGEAESGQVLSVVAEALLRLIKTHVLARPPGEAFPVNQRLEMATLVLEAWAELGVQPEPLEQACTEEHLGKWAWHMLHAVLMDLLVMEEDDEVLGRLPEFSDAFCAGLTTHVMDYGREMEREGITNLWSTGGLPNPLGHAESDKSMWQSFYEQARRMEREVDRDGGRVEVPVAALTDALARQESRASTAADGDKRLYVFSCGHVLTKIEMHRAIGALETRLTSLKRPLHLTAEVLSQEYRDTSRAMRVACPTCVTGFFVDLVDHKVAEEAAAEQDMDRRRRQPGESQVLDELENTGGVLEEGWEDGALVGAVAVPRRSKTASRLLRPR